MGFVGMFIIVFVIVLIIAGTLLLMSFILLIVGIVRMRRSKPWKVFIVTSGVLFALVVIPVIFVALPVKVDINTPDGSGYVWSNQKDKFFSAIYEGDTAKVDRLLDKNPKLVYVIKRGDNTDGLHAAIMMNDLDTAKCIIEHGGAFDSGYNFSKDEYTYSLEFYFDNYYRHAYSDDLKYTDCECVKFMIENNAEVSFVDNSLSVLFYAVNSICYDGTISDDEVSMIKLLIDSGADAKEKSPVSGETPLDVFLDRADNINLSEEEMNEIIPLLKTD